MKFLFNKKKGISLVDTLIAITIFSFLMISVGIMVVHFMRTQTDTLQQIRSASEARIAIKRLSRSLTNMSNGADGSFPVVSANDDELVYYSDLDGDLVTERIRYYVADQIIREEILFFDSTSQTYTQTGKQDKYIIGSVINTAAEPLFLYYQKGYDGLNTPETYQLTEPINIAQINSVEINLMVNVDPANNPDTFNIKEHINLRNLHKSI
jgi:type II secretory pathway pseudopilin PulG